MLHNDSFLKKGETHIVVITDISFNSDHDLIIWAQAGEKIDETLDNISNTLHHAVVQLKNFTSIQKGSFCMCQYTEDQEWYRACIEDMPSPGKWKARFIDYGNSQVFNGHDLYELPQQLCNIPGIAIRLILDDSIQPLNSAGVWTSSVIEAIIDSFLYNRVCVQITKVCDGSLFEVHCKEINALLKEKGYASTELAYPHSSFSVGKKLQAYVSNVTEDGTIYLQELESSKKLDELMVLLAEHYALPDNLIPVDEVDFVSGNLVAAVYSRDHSFYRAHILSVEGNHCTVCFIDYGNIEQQEKSTIFKLNEKFHCLNFQAIACHLHDLQIPVESYSKSLQNILLDNLSEQLVSIEIKEHRHSSKLSVTGFHEGEKLGTSLVVAGLAKLRHSQPSLLYKFIEIEEGSVHDMLISHVEPSGIFFATKLSECSKMDKLTDELAEYCPNAELLTDVAIEKPCCALFSEDDTWNWYRASIKSLSKENACVFFVDFGNCSECSIKSLRIISQTSMELSCQAVQCSILRQLNSNEIQKLHSLVGEVVQIKFLKKNYINSFTVKLVHEGKTMFLPSANLSADPEVNTEQKHIHEEPNNYRFKPGTEDIVEVTYVESVNEIWGRLKSNSAEYDELSDNLQHFCNTLDKNSVQHQPALLLGSFCAVFDVKSDKWFRGEITSMPAKFLYSVFLIDVGVTMNVSEEAIIPLPLDDLVKYSSQALRLSIQESIKLTNEVQVAKLRNVLMHNSFSLTFGTYNTANGFYEVNLFGDSGKQVDLHYISSNMAENVGTFEPVAVCFVEDPDCMWIQRLSNDRQLNKLMKDMKIFYNSLPSSVLCFQQSPQFDNRCSVKIEEGEIGATWYRGKILCLYGDIVEVKLIDFGNEIRAKLKNIKMLSAQFEQLEPQAFKCKLFNIRPFSEQWTVAAIHKLFDLTKSAKAISGKFIEKQSLAHVVDLIVERDGREFHVNEHLVQLNHAVWIEKHSGNETSPVPPHCSSISPDQLSISSGRSSKSGFQKLFYHSPGIALLGADIKVIATKVESPDNFFLKIDDPVHCDRYLKLEDKVDAACSSLDIREDELYVGMPCSVFHNTLKQWCRGAILHFQDVNNLEVCLVDHGCMIECNLGNLRSILPQFVLEAPPAAMRCTLRGIITCKSAWTVNALNITRKYFLNNQNLTCTIHACASDDLGTFFISSIRSPLCNLADELVKAGEALKLDVMGKLLPPLKLKSFVYSNLDIVKGREASFFITHVENANLIYCQISTQIPSINSMLHDLQQHCIRSDRILVYPEILVQDCVCFAKRDGKQWNRAHFVSMGQSGFVKVMFVDHGNTEVLQVKDVQKFAGEIFFELPIQALPCSLEDVDVTCGSSEKKESVLNLLNNLLLNKCLNGVVTGSTNGKLHLDLFSEGKRINDYIAKKALLDVPQNSVKANAYITTNKMIDVAHIWKGEKKVFISHVLSGSEVFLQETEALSKVEDLMFELNDDVALESMEVSPKENTFCLARYDADDQLYRALVEKQIYDNDDCKRFSVLFVDYGNTSTVNLSDLKQISSELASIPQAALRCKLSLVPGSIAQSNLTCMLQDLSAAENVAILASVSCISSEGCYVADLTVQPNEKECVSLSIYLSSSMSAGVCDNAVDANNCTSLSIVSETFQYRKMKNIVDVKSYEIFISHVENPGHVYCQFSENCENLDTMMHDIHVYYTIEREDDKVTSIHSIVLNSPCIAKYQQDGNWYRATVEEVGDNNDVTVRFVDYGNCEVLPISEIRKIKAEFCELPIQAICCYVALVNNSTSAWSVEEIDSFDERVADLKLMATFSKIIDENLDIFEVTLKLPNGTFLHKELLNNDAEETETEERYQNGSKMKQDPENALLTKEYDLSSDTATANIHLSEMPIKEGMVKDCFVSYAKDFNDFCLQLEESEIDLDSLYRMTADDAQADKTDQFKPTDMSMGRYCIVQNANDGEWYRGKVTACGDRADVLFVDYGDSASVEWSNIKVMTKRTSKLPVQGIPCCLARLENLHDDEIKAVNDSFFNIVMDNLLKVTFVEKLHLQWKVEIRIDDVDIFEKLQSTTSSANTKSEPSVAINGSFVQPPQTDVVLGESPRQNHICNYGNLIQPGTILKGEIIYALSYGDFYVKVDDALFAKPEANKNDKQPDIVGGLELFWAKQTEHDEWKEVVMLKNVNGKNLTLFIDSGIFVECDEVYETKVAEQLKTVSQVLHCKLPKLSCSKINLIEFLKTHVLRKNVFITFFEVDQTSSAWIVDIVLAGKCINNALQDFLNTADRHQILQTSETENFECSSTALVPDASAIVKANTNHLHEQNFCTNVNENPVFKNSVTEDLIDHFTAMCREVKSLVLHSASAERVVRVVDEALSYIDHLGVEASVISHTGDGDCKGSTPQIPLTVPSSKKLNPVTGIDTISDKSMSEVNSLEEFVVEGIKETNEKSFEKLSDTSELSDEETTPTCDHAVDENRYIDEDSETQQVLESKQNTKGGKSDLVSNSMLVVADGILTSVCQEAWLEVSSTLVAKEQQEDCNQKKLNNSSITSDERLSSFVPIIDTSAAENSDDQGYFDPADMENDIDPSGSISGDSGTYNTPLENSSIYVFENRESADNINVKTEGEKINQEGLFVKLDGVGLVSEEGAIEEATSPDDDNLSPPNVIDKDKKADSVCANDAVADHSQIIELDRAVFSTFESKTQIEEVSSTPDADNSEHSFSDDDFLQADSSKLVLLEDKGDCYELSMLDSNEEQVASDQNNTSNIIVTEKLDISFTADERLCSFVPISDTSAAVIKFDVKVDSGPEGNEEAVDSSTSDSCDSDTYDTPLENSRDQLFHNDDFPDEIQDIIDNEKIIEEENFNRSNNGSPLRVESGNYEEFATPDEDYLGLSESEDLPSVVFPSETEPSVESRQLVLQTDCQSPSDAYEEQDVIETDELFEKTHDESFTTCKCDETESALVTRETNHKQVEETFHDRTEHGTKNEEVDGGTVVENLNPVINESDAADVKGSLEISHFDASPTVVEVKERNECIASGDSSFVSTAREDLTENAEDGAQ